MARHTVRIQYRAPEKEGEGLPVESETLPWISISISSPGRILRGVDASVDTIEGRRLRLPSGHEWQVTGIYLRMMAGVNSRGKPRNSEGG